MKNLCFSTILLILVFGNLHARGKSKVFNEDLITKIELQVKKSIELGSLNEAKKYEIYAVAARELMGYGYYEKSLNYYELALESKLDRGMEETYYNKLFLKYQLKKSSTELKISLKEFENYLVKSKSSDKYSYILASWKLMLSEDGEMTSSNSLFAPQFSQKKMKKLVNDKKFAEALQILPERLGQANINLQIQSDILKTIVFGRTQKLYCTKKLKKYPNSFAYTMQICKYLKDSQLVAISDIEARIKKESPKRLFWIDALKEIK